MDRVALLNRTDTKYIFNFSALGPILEEVTGNYDVLEINGQRFSNYKTLYYDTPEFKSFLDHHNGKVNRTKIRFRNYVDSGITFLEIKFKNNKERTIKSRIQVDHIEETLSERSKAFIGTNSVIDPDTLIPTLWNNFSRITLVHKTDNERLTIDFNLAFEQFGKVSTTAVDHLVIAEVKQEKVNVNSDFIKTVKKRHIRTSGMSKYCVGTAMLNKDVKSNNFKERILKIKKLEHA